MQSSVDFSSKAFLGPLRVEKKLTTVGCLTFCSSFNMFLRDKFHELDPDLPAVEVYKAIRGIVRIVFWQSDVKAKFHIDGLTPFDCNRQLDSAFVLRSLMVKRTTIAVIFVPNLCSSQ